MAIIAFLKALSYVQLLIALLCLKRYRMPILSAFLQQDLIALSTKALS
jgi:hypothetical protein